MPRASEVLSDQADGYLFSESAISTTCLACERLQTLDEAIFDASNKVESNYLCFGCLNTILIVSAPESRDARGYLLGNWVLRNPNDIIVNKTHTGRAIRFVASPHALAAIHR